MVTKKKTIPKETFQNVKDTNTNHAIIDAYEKSVEHLKWSLRIIITIFLAFLVYIMFKDHKDYTQAVQNARNAAMDASKYEERALTSLNSIDEKAKEKLASLDDKAESIKRDLEIQIEKHGKLTKLWADFFMLSTPGLANEDALKPLEKLMEENSDNSELKWYYSELLLALAEKASREKKDPTIWLDNAEQFYRKLLDEDYNDYFGSAAYYLACIYALRNNENECRQWLKVCDTKGGLPTKEEAESEYLFDNVKKLEWFQSIQWKEETK